MKFWQRKQRSDADAQTSNQRHDAYNWIEQAVHLAQDNRDAGNARRLIQNGLAAFKSLGDEVGEVNALHFRGRIEHELGNLDQAMSMYDQALAMARSMNYEPVIARAMHERARIFKERFMFSAAEDGFRHALHYYATQHDGPNLQATLNQMSDLADIALHSPEFFLNSLEHDGVPIGTPEDYLYVRALAILAEIRDEGHLFRQRLLQKAMATFKRDAVFARYILEEARATASFRQDFLISQLADLLEKAWALPAWKAQPPHEVHPVSHKRGTQFNTPESAARNIEDLYNYLAQDDSADTYVYRGQTCEYPGPLLPSMYRRYLTEGASCLTCNDSLYQYSLRMCGKKYYGEYNRQFFESLNHVFDGVSLQEAQAVEAVYKKALKDAFAVRSQVSKLFERREILSWEDALRLHFSSGEMAIYERYRKQWKLYVDNYHRRTIRMFGLFKPFGYLLGTTLAQQFGLSSEGLDATRSLPVAVFFATHRSNADYEALEHQGTGIIYRFPYTPSDIRNRPLNDYTYYTLPSIIDLNDVMYRFERPGFRHEDVRDLFETYYGAIHVEDFKDYDLFMVPEGAVRESRIGRQRAVIILPDELRKDRSDVEPGVDGITLPEFQYIEDLAFREGVEKFYFCHTGTLPSSVSITREQLWPRRDPFLEIIISIMTALYPILTFKGHVVPQRLDLIDGGYNAAEFLELCKTLIHREPTVLVSFQELNAMRYGTLTI